MFDAESANYLMETAKLAISRDFSKISTILLQKEIKKIVHFTHSSNIKSILDLGLHSRTYLRSNKIDFRETDKERFDGLPNGFSCSITTPNLSMLKTKEAAIGKDFIVLEISSNSLLTSSFAAFPGNAATGVINRDAATNSNDYVGARGLGNLFLNVNERRIHSRSTSEPTDFQSEIVFFESILPDRIRGIHVPSYISETSKINLKIVETAFSNIQICSSCPHGYFKNAYQALPTFQLSWKSN